ncbi:hypothetical protein C2G38_2049858 [Gigaspora rosea]|uniref:Uncharacterized protein n=1 Tax=Gigaspora rosea TaxID=44941 RepID=A0A397U0Y7_9GLOM|nr:hypothetical protein C2G38_2049858 [Gigaspora rosea]
MAQWIAGKMKNYWGAAFQNVRNSIWKVFGVEKLPLLKSNAGASEIVSGAYWIDLITRDAFSTAAVPILTHDYYAFTLAVCDIILNPQSRSVKCTEKRMKRRIEKFLNDYNSGGPSYGSAEAIMDEELEANEHKVSNELSSDRLRI